MKRFLSIAVMILTLYLGLYRNYLALWDTDQPQPKTVYPYHISLYPKIDRSLLKKGIEITSESQLSQLMDDFLS